MTTAQKIRRALNALGQTPDDIADALYQMGIRGIVGSPTDCPLAVYLRGKVPGAGCGKCVAGGGGVHVVLEYWQQQFVEGFDQECYPELIGEPEAV